MSEAIEKRVKELTEMIEGRGSETEEESICIWLDILMMLIEKEKINYTFPQLVKFQDSKQNKEARFLSRQIMDEWRADWKR